MKFIANYLSIKIAGYDIPISSLVLAIVLVLVLIAVILYRYNHRKQTKVAGYIDNECSIYNKKGLDKFLQKKGKKLSNPTLVAVEIRNLAYLYTNYTRRKTLMYNISNLLIRNLTKNETAGRIEFNKFILVLENRSREDVKKLCTDIEERFTEFNIDNYGKYYFYIYFGVYENPPIENKDVLFHTAAIILYSTARDNNIYYYGDEVKQALEILYRMNEQKTPAYEQKRFVPYIQPKVDFRTGKVVGGEILCRWVDDKQEFLFKPSQFIPLFEDNGFITKIDDLMLDSACSLAQTLSTRGRSDIIISVNISKIKFLSPNFERDIMDIVSRYQISPKNIELEITESIVVGNPQHFSNCIMTLRALGFKVAMDDFGKEYSSLGSLSTNPFDTIKLDMVFFKNQLSTDKTKLIVRNVLDMLSKLDYEIVCEGIADRQTLDVLATINRDVIIQGYVFSKPIPISQFEAFLGTTFEFDYPEIEVVDSVPSKEKENSSGNGSEVIIEKQNTPNGGTSINISGLGNDHSSELEEMRRQMIEMQRNFNEALEEQRRAAQNEQMRILQEEIRSLKNQPAPQQQPAPQPVQQPAPQPVQQRVDRYDYRDDEIYRLRRELEDVRYERSRRDRDRYEDSRVYHYFDSSRDDRYDDLKREINDLKQQQQPMIDVNELIKRLSQTQTENSRYQIEKAEEEAKDLRAKLERERKEREELEAMVSELKNQKQEEEEPLNVEQIQKEQEEANKKLDLNINVNHFNRDEDDDDEDDEDDDDEVIEKPNLTLEELQAIIQSYQDKYKDDWNEHAKDELKEGYYQVVDGLKYYQKQVKKTFLEKIKKATPEQKQIFNIVKNEFMKYGVTNKLTSTYDRFYKGRNLVGKVTLTSSKVKVYVAADPNNPKYKSYPHKDLSSKKAHVSTPYYALLKSPLSVKRICTVIDDAMSEAGLSEQSSYKAIDYAIKYKFHKKDSKDN